MRRVKLMSVYLCANNEVLSLWSRFKKIDLLEDLFFYVKLVDFLLIMVSRVVLTGQPCGTSGKVA